MHTVVETKEFLARAEGLLGEARRYQLVDWLAVNPDHGKRIPGTGGARKFRWAASGKGKSGGVRVITFYSGARIPVFILSIFGKNERADLSQSERNELKKLLRSVVEEYRKESQNVEVG